jgi:hypothetical protein
MRARIIIGPGGEIQVVTETGTFEAGRQAIEELVAALGIAGLGLQADRPIEQHRHTHIAAEGVHDHEHA